MLLLLFRWDNDYHYYPYIHTYILHNSYIPLLLPLLPLPFHRQDPDLLLAYGNVRSGGGDEHAPGGQGRAHRTYTLSFQRAGSPDLWGTLVVVVAVYLHVIYIHSHTYSSMYCIYIHVLYTLHIHYIYIHNYYTHTI